MKIIVTYIHPLGGSGHWFNLAVRFLSGYQAFPPGLDHETVVVCNGAPVTDETQFIFGSLSNVKFMEHDNSGFDVGAFQHAAREHPCDLMVFLGASTYFKGPGWLSRMAGSWQKWGPGLYGVMGNRGVSHAGVSPHIRSTGFWLSPDLFNQYPMQVTLPEQRYPFEHGDNCLTTWMGRRGLKSWVVGWSGEYQQAQWDLIPNGFHQGDQSDLLVGDRICEPPYYHSP